MEQRRAYLRAIFARPRGARIHELIDAAVHAFSDEVAEGEPETGLQFPNAAQPAQDSPVRVAV